jgi:hypothetical protein
VEAILRVGEKLSDDPLGEPSAAMKQLHMSARAYHRILKLAWTIADPSMPQGRPGRQRREPDGALGGGDSVPTEKANLIS